MAEITVTKQNFEEEVLKSTLPVMIDFWATWCGPCRMLAPTVAEIAEENVGKIKVCKVNVDDEPELAQAFRIASIPTIVMMKNGKVTNTAIGYRDKASLLALL